MQNAIGSLMTLDKSHSSKEIIDGEENSGSLFFFFHPLPFNIKDPRRHFYFNTGDIFSRLSQTTADTVGIINDGSGAIEAGGLVIP